MKTGEVIRPNYSNAMSEKPKLHECDYLGGFILRFHALIDSIFLIDNEFLNWFNIFSLLAVGLYALSHWACTFDFPYLISQAAQSPGFVSKFSNKFPCPVAFLCLSALIKILSLVESTMMFTTTSLLSASLYVSKRGAYWDRLCRDVVGRWLVGRWSLVVGCHARALWPNGAF